MFNGVAKPLKSLAASEQLWERPESMRELKLANDDCVSNLLIAQANTF